MAQIRQITIVGTDRVFKVGQEVNGRIVSQIKNVSQEFDSGIHSEYWVADEQGELIVTIEIAPVIVYWE